MKSYSKIFACQTPDQLKKELDIFLASGPEILQMSTSTMPAPVGNNGAHTIWVTLIVKSGP